MKYIHPFILKSSVLTLILSIILIFSIYSQSTGQVTGELKKWHPVTLTFEGPEVSETDSFNPFLGYRLNVTFRHESGREVYNVPGFYAADGNAAETSAISGSKWRVIFTPDRTGEWEYVASFRRGQNVAISQNPTAGEGVAFDGARGTLNIGDTDKSGDDQRGKGMLRYVGERYLRFDNGEWFMKGGADAPETLLAYEDFDGTRLQTGKTNHSYDDELLWGSTQHNDRRGPFPLKSYQAHVQDWDQGDPEWQNGKGKGLIGALNYLAEEGMNAFSFLTLTAGGDGKNVCPWINHKEFGRYDVSKLAQWNIVMSHADRLGLFIHVKTQETENDLLLDGGELGTMRKLYYRELVARFAHHHALNWNLGEELDIVNELNDPEMNYAKSYSKYIHNLDPYNHPVVAHTYPGNYDRVYGPLLGFEYFEGPSIQTNNLHVWNNFERVRSLVERSDQSGRNWNVSLDEAGTGGLGVTTDDRDGNYNQDNARAIYWATIAAGGDGMEWYFGYSEEHNDLVLEDWRSRDELWDYTRYALQFYKENNIPFWEMDNANNLTRSEKDFVFAKPGEVYVIYLPKGGASAINLQQYSGTYTIDWYNPREGGDLQKGRPLNVQKDYTTKPERVTMGAENPKSPEVNNGRVIEVNGPGLVSLGTPPVEEEVGQDWVILLRKK